MEEFGTKKRVMCNRGWEKGRFCFFLKSFEIIKEGKNLGIQWAVLSFSLQTIHLGQFCKSALKRNEVTNHKG